ncbi:MAG TPA: copper ion binding protein, partial [Marinagarivorans sp.]
MSQVNTRSAPEPSAAISLPIKGMTCASCVGRVEAALGKVSGVASVAVNLATERADIRPAGPVDYTALVEAVAKVGYKVPATTTTLAIEGMTCASCLGRVERALKAVSGVSQATVNLATERATVQGTASVESLTLAIKTAGYAARDISAMTDAGDGSADED